MHNIEFEQGYKGNEDFSGHLKIWRFCFISGAKTTEVDKKNTVLYTGADVLALCLSGAPNSAISHMYLGFNNNGSFDINAEPAVTKASTSFRSDGDYGYIRLPLSFPASFQTETNYDNNKVYFTVMLTSAPASTGAVFGNGSKIFAAGLIAARNPAGANQDIIFSKTHFTPVTYDTGYGLTVTWGVKFIAN